MSRRARTALFLAGGAGLVALLAWGFAGLPAFGDYHGVYGHLLNQRSLGQTHAMNTVVAVTFDYRGFDTLGEEFILFASVLGVALLLREARSRPPEEVDVREPFDPVRATGTIATPLFFLLGLFVIAHGNLTPGGGFQGGVVTAVAIVLIGLAADRSVFHRLAPKPFADLLEGIGVGAYAAIGVGGVAAGAAFLQSFDERGKIGQLTSGGTIPLLNWATGIEVTAAVVLIASEFFEELEER